MDFLKFKIIISYLSCTTDSMCALAREISAFCISDFCKGYNDTCVCFRCNSFKINVKSRIQHKTDIYGSEVSIGCFIKLLTFPLVIKVNLKHVILSLQASIATDHEPCTCSTIQYIHYTIRIRIEYIPPPLSPALRTKLHCKDNININGTYFIITQVVSLTNETK